MNSTLAKLSRVPIIENAPPSAYLAETPEGQIDPVYLAEYGLELETGITRDENGNAMGGIRMLDLEIGRGQYIAFDPPSFFGLGLFGTWKDLQCEPLDGRARFPNHGTYVSQFAHHAQRLVAEGYLLLEGADLLNLRSGQVGGRQAPRVYSVAVGEGHDGQWGPLRVGPHSAPCTGGLIPIGAGLGLRRWGKASR